MIRVTMKLAAIDRLKWHQ